MRLFIAAGAVALSIASGASASVILSENFDAVGFRGAFLQNDVTDRFGPSVLYYAQDSAGWSFADGYAGGFPHVLIATTVLGKDGALWLQETGSSASHALTGLTVGQLYTVSFLQSGDNVAGGAWNYTVAVDGGTIYSGSGVTQAPGTNPGQPITTSFVAAHSSAVLTFADATTTSGANVVVDNISVSGVPEPTTWGLMLAGFGMVGTLARRRRAVAA